MDDREAMRAAIALAAQALFDDEGGPFGAIVVLGGRVVGRGRNRVLARRDPTAHAEVEAIRDACRALGTHALVGGTIFATCEPCPMCRGAILWARLDRLVEAADRADAAAAGFDDARFHALGEGRAAGGPRVERLLAAEARDVMRRWAARPDRPAY
jgi:tRNA(Arg) A34 adenosine deaminase TadA